MNIVIRSSKTVRREVRPGCPLYCFTYSRSFSNHFHLPIFCCRATCRGLNFSAKVICPSQSCQCRCSAASEPQKSSSPLSSVFLRISLVRLFLPPSECRKNHPDGRKQAEQREIKNKVKYELRQIKITGSQRGSHRNRNENQGAGQKGYTRGKSRIVPIFGFRWHQGSVEHRHRPTHRRQHGRTNP